MMRALTLTAIVGAIGLSTATARADIERYAVIIGENQGAADDVLLHHAETDAARVRDVLQELGGFSSEHSMYLVNVDAASVRRTLIEVNDRIRAHTDGAHPTMLVVYYSGHGDAVSLHLRGTSLDLSELEHLVSGSAATFRVLITDACRSGGLTRVKGGKAAPAIAISIGEQLAAQGAVFLTSSAANESAQESDALGGSFFTHYLVSGLLGAADADGDGRVSLVEAYRYAYDRTLGASSETLAGLQHPTFEYEIRGKGEIILTMPGQKRSDRGFVTFPAGFSYLVFTGGREGMVVAELGRFDEVRRLNLARGRYFVRGRGASELVEGSLDVASGDDRVLDHRGFDHVAYARLVRKGGGELRLVHGPELGMWIGTPAITGLSACIGGFAGYAVDLAWGSIVARGGACRARRSGMYLEDTLEMIDLELDGTHAWDVGPVTVALGVAVGSSLLVRTFTTTGNAPTRTTLAPDVGAIGSLSVPLRHGFYVAGDVSAGTLFFREASMTQGGSTAWTAQFRLRGGLAIGKQMP
jgi:hypothetical protein